MELNALLVLATASSAAFGGAGVLLGLAFGVRAVQRDEGRWKAALSQLETLSSGFTALRMEWATAQENLDQLAGAVETKRRRAAASLSAQERKEREAAGQMEVTPATPQEIRNQIRRGIPRIAARR